MRFILGFAFFISFQFSLAGNGWIISGGDYVKDAHNPWWLHNTQTIHYCVSFDEESVSTNQAKAERIIETVFQNWLREWKYHYQNHPWYDSVLIGNQKISKLAKCNGEEDLAFVLGWNALTAEQKEVVKSRTKYQSLLGMAARESYDPVTLKGRGFIYIASDKGPHSFVAGEETVQQPWQHAFYLSFILAHEIGHTLGVKHGEHFGFLMFENFVEVFFAKENQKWMGDILNYVYDFRFFSREESYIAFRFETYDPDGKPVDSFIAYKELFGDQIKDTIEIKKASAESDNLDIFTYNVDQSPQLTHKIITGIGSTDLTMDAVVTAYVTQEQSLIPIGELSSIRLYLFHNSSTKNTGHLLNLNTGEKTPVLILRSAEKIEIIFLKEDEYKTLWFSSNMWGTAVNTNQGFRGGQRPLRAPSILYRPAYKHWLGTKKTRPELPIGAVSQ
jgi:hypothetical protein